MAKKKPQRPSPSSSPAARPASAPPLVRRPDRRRWIYAALDVVFLGIYVAVVSQLETRFTLDKLQLMTLPLFAGAMAAGTLVAGRIGWWIAVAGCGALLLSAVLLIIRIIVSAAYLGAVFGGFGQMATGIALIAAALIIEVAALLPLFQLKYLMTRAGRRALGVAPPVPARATT